MFGSNESAAVGVFRAVENRGQKGKVKVVGFDASSDLLSRPCKDGSIDALVVQNPFRIGHDAVMAAVAAFQKQPVEKRVDTGVVVVTRENLDEPGGEEGAGRRGVSKAPLLRSAARPAALRGPAVFSWSRSAS